VTTRFLSLAGLVFVLAGCSNPSATPITPASTPTVVAPAATPDLPAAQPEIAPTQDDASRELPSSQNVEIPGAEGLTLIGVFYPSPSVPAPGVLLLHMYAGSRSDWQEFARSLQGAGFAALAIDLRGHGDTGGIEDWVLAREDVAAACAWLGAHQGVDGNRLGLVGASIGANLALVQGAREPSVDAIALLSPGFDYFRVQIQGLIEEYGDRPSLLVASEEDAYSAETVRVLSTTAPGEAELLMLTSAGHGTAMLEGDPELAGRLIAFLARSL